MLERKWKCVCEASDRQRPPTVYGEGGGREKVKQRRNEAAQPQRKEKKEGAEEKNKQRENRGKIEGGGAEKGRGEQGPKKGDGVRRWTKKREGGRRKNQESCERKWRGTQCGGGCRLA